MIYYQKISISPNIIELFQKNKYETLVLSIMNSSKLVFPEKYESIKDQSHGECDYIGKTSNAKYDAKLPFLPQQIELLTDGKKHGPLIHKWLEEMHEETVEFQPLRYREDPNYTVKGTRLFEIMKRSILRDKSDENIIFFIPFPVVPTLHDPVFLDKTANFLTKIFDGLKEDCDLKSRAIYIIHPSLEMNVMVLRNLNTKELEYVSCNALEQYISFKITKVIPEA